MTRGVHQNLLVFRVTTEAIHKGGLDLKIKIFAEATCDDFFQIQTNTIDLLEMIISSGDVLYPGNMVFFFSKQAFIRQDCYWRLVNIAEAQLTHYKELRVSFQHISLEG